MDREHVTGPVSDEVLDVGEALRVIDSGRRSIRSRLYADPSLMFGVWGVAWLAGFGATYLAHGSGRVIPGWLGVVTPTVLIAAAIVWTIGYSIWAGRGVSGPSRSIGAAYGWSWMIAFCCLAAVNSALIHRGLSSDNAAMLWSASALLLVGVLYLAGGVLWQDKAQYALGVWTMLSAAGAVFAGVPGNFAVQALAGGGGFLVLAGYHRYGAARRSRA